MSDKLTVKMVLRFTRAQAKYLDDLTMSGRYANRAELLRSIIDVMMADDLDHHGNGKDSAGADAPRPPWGD